MSAPVSSPLPTTLTAYTAAAARGSLLALLDTPAANLDASGVESCDALGLQLLVSARLRADALERRWSIVSPSAALRDACDFCGLPISTLSNC